LRINNAIKILCIIIIFLFPSDIYPTHKKLKTVVLKENLSIGDINDFLLYQWAGIVVDEEGNIFLTDLKDYSLKKFNSEGQLLKRAGGKGEGPGEFNSPVTVKLYNERIYISEIYKTGIQVFNKNLDFISAISIDHVIQNFEIISQNEIAASCLLLDYSSDDSYIYFFSLDGNEETRIKYGAKDKIPLLDSIDFCFDEEKNIYIAYKWKDNIKKLNRKGALIFEKRLLGIKKPIMSETKTQLGKHPNKMIYKNIELDIYGNIFILGGHVSKNSSRDIYILNNMGNHRATVTLAEPSHTIYIDKKNFLYTSADQGITLKRYSMEYVYE